MNKTVVARFVLVICFVTLSFNSMGCSPAKKIQPKMGKPIVRTGEVLKRKPIIYNIQGVSNKISPKAEFKMDRWRKEIVTTAAKNPSTVYINGPTTKKLVCLTFDDGPDNKVTPRILDILKSYGVHGNFFFVGQNIIRYPGIVKRAYQEGNLVLNHSFSHPNFQLKTISAKDINHEIQETNQLFQKFIGKTPALVRPPYGVVNQKVLSVATTNRLKLVIWSIDTLDWSQKEKPNIVNNVLHNVRPGEIILMHSNEDKGATALALPTIIKGLKARGYQIVTLDKLLNVKAYK